MFKSSEETEAGKCAIIFYVLIYINVGFLVNFLKPFAKSVLYASTTAYPCNVNWNLEYSQDSRGMCLTIWGVSGNSELDRKVKVLGTVKSPF